MEVKEIIKKLGYQVLDRQEKELDLWKSYFQGNVKNFHKYSEYLGAEIGRADRERKTLGMPKVISELWADNIINPETKVVITPNEETEDNKLQAWWDDINVRMGIEVKLNDLTELIFALGNGATVQSIENNRPIQQYISMDHIFPLREDLGEIVDCAFVDVSSGEIYIQAHIKLENGTYEIYNHYFDSEGKPILKEDVEPMVTSDVKLFQLYKPAIVNNINIGNPLGISIYANALDESKAVDIAYDSIDKEVRNGRTRLILRTGALHTDKGKKYPVFDKEQDEFYVLPEDEEDGGKDPVTIKQGSFNTDPLVTVLEKHINLMGSKCGLGDNAFYAKDGTIYTNTEQVVSSNSKFYKTRRKHATRIEKSLIEMVKALYYLDTGKELDANIYVEFDDSIIHDKEAEYNRSRLEVMQGLKSHIQHFMDTMDLTQEEAKAYWQEQLEFMALKPDVEEEGGEV